MKRICVVWNDDGGFMEEVTTFDKFAKDLSSAWGKDPDLIKIDCATLIDITKADVGEIISFRSGLIFIVKQGK